MKIFGVGGLFFTEDSPLRRLLSIIKKMLFNQRKEMTK